MFNRFSKMVFISMLVFITALSFSSCAGGENKSAKEKKSDIITLQMREIQSFNPLCVDNHSIRDIFSLCYEPLFCVDENMKLKGVLAERIQMSEDCLTAVVTLKDSVLWHDGIKLTSADVVHTVNLLMANPEWEYYQCVKNIDSICAIDALSLKISLKKPYGQIAYSLYFPILPSHNEVPEEKIIGTGAYAFEKYTQSVLLELKRFDRWHKGQAKCPGVNVSVIRDNQTATTSFNSGLIHAITSESFDVQNNAPKETTNSYGYPTGQYEMMVLNHKNRFFSSPIIRSAVSFAIDRKKIITECYAGNAVEANSPIYPGAQSEDNSSGASWYSVANSNELLFMEGFVKSKENSILRDNSGREFTFSLLVNSENESRVRTAEIIREQLFAAGINVIIKKADFEEYSALIARGEFDSYLGGARLGNMYDFEFLFSPEGKMNNYSYSSEQMNTAMDNITKAPTEESRLGALDSFEELFLREQPVLGLAFKNEILLTSHQLNTQNSPEYNRPYAHIGAWSVTE